SSRAQSIPHVSPRVGSGDNTGGAYCITASSLLIPVGRHPQFRCRGVTPVRSLFGAQRRSVLSTVCTPRAPPRPAELRVAIRLASGNGGDSTAPRVHRRSIQDHRHTDGGAPATHPTSPTHR